MIDSRVIREEVPPGYKQTDVGVIPEDWEAIPLCEDISLLSGHHVLARHCNTHGDGVPYLTGPADFPEGHIQQTKFTTHPTTLCHKGDILVTVKGSGSGSLIEADASYCISRQLMAIRVKQWNSKFLYYSLLQNANQIKAASTGLIPGLSRSDILDQRIPLPPTVIEQRAIAAALSDADGLIGALDALIEKKRAIKQAAMQQLLTGKKRLPGFAGEWETKRLGEVASIRNQKTLPSNVDPDTLCVELEHIGQGNGRLLEVSTARNSTSSKYRFFNGDVLFGRLRSYLRKFWHADRDGICTTEIWPLMVDASQADSGFLYSIVQSDRFVEAASISYGTHMPRADWNVMKNFEVCLPPLPEQRAIATVLSDMDAELAALERRRDKIKQIKQGMMQQLLTGRIRLVEPPEAAA
ncbi:restriction endonuclease subunit S [Methanoculleus sp. 10]|jgi:type I restriction enzyme S subunit|uniref:restriction endonuclease subunit S n=1 Tax=Methanoculleus sp. 10 TaxID=430615 RepID=UPI001B69A98E|nr:restriction endonuclease subunit S [Methanoculleus sp. 10]MBP7410155.1 restriction endonuclease subunit S [Methanoculleus sp.]